MGTDIRQQAVTMSDYDTVIIGSGIGGLTCGAFLARAGMKVAVFEKHTKIGGYAHNFKRGPFTFESGIHSVPMKPGGTISYLLELLGLDTKLSPVELTEMYAGRMPGFEFTMPSEQNAIREALFSRFPDQKGNFGRFFGAMSEFDLHILQRMREFEKGFNGPDNEFEGQFHNVSFSQYLGRFLDNPDARLAFGAQWPYAGLAPEFGGALFYTMMFLVHYLEGTHTLPGGFHQLADLLASVITSAGGMVRPRSEVVAVHTEDKAARSIELANGEEITADTVVANVSPYLLYDRLLARDAGGKLIRRRLKNLSPSVSSVIVYLGMKPGFEKLLGAQTLFWFGSKDFSSIYHTIHNHDKLPLDHLIFLAPPVSDPAHPTLTLMMFAERALSENWKEYKKIVADKMLLRAEELYPGLREYIVRMEVGSPATFERYTANTDGALYGFENTHKLYGEAKLPSKLHLKNLYQAGHWGRPGGGVLNVMYNGYMCYHSIMAES